MRLPPMLASLTRHKLIVVLIIATTALTSAVITNIAVMFVHRVELMGAPSGVSESALVVVDSSKIYDGQSGGGTAHHDNLPQYQADIAALRGIEGIHSAATINGLPFGGGTAIDISGRADTEADAGFQVTAFNGGPDFLNALGLRLVQGRDFLRSEYLPSDNFNNVKKVSVAILSRALADRLFHTGAAVGRLLYASGHPIQVVGVVDHLMGMSPQLGASDNEYAMLLPLEPDSDSVTFVLNADPGARDRVMQRALMVLLSRDPTRILDNEKPFTQLRAEYFQREGSLVSLLLATGIALLTVTAGGILGLVSFWVRQRTRGIGIRRALGARRVDILYYFLVENFLIVTAGVLLGCVLACALNWLLVTYYEVQVLPLGYLAVGALSLWLTGLVAGLSPALRAASVPPAVATRSI